MEEKNNRNAIISFVIAIVALLCMFYPDQKTVSVAFAAMVFLGLTSTILGFMAKREIAKTPQKGKGYATAGVVIGIIMIVFGIFGFLGLELLKNEDLVNQNICPLLTECVEKDETHYTCDYYGTPITCKKEVIDKNKKEE